MKRKDRFCFGVIETTSQGLMLKSVATSEVNFGPSLENDVLEGADVLERIIRQCKSHRLQKLLHILPDVGQGTIVLYRYVEMPADGRGGQYIASFLFLEASEAMRLRFSKVWFVLGLLLRSSSPSVKFVREALDFDGDQKETAAVRHLRPRVLVVPDIGVAESDSVVRKFKELFEDGVVTNGVRVFGVTANPGGGGVRKELEKIVEKFSFSPPPPPPLSPPTPPRNQQSVEGETKTVTTRKKTVDSSLGTNISDVAPHANVPPAEAKKFREVEERLRTIDSSLDLVGKQLERLVLIQVFVALILGLGILFLLSSL